MKRKLSLFLVLVMVLTMALSGCGKKELVTMVILQVTIPAAVPPAKQLITLNHLMVKNSLLRKSGLTRKLLTQH
jgi:hypothetical protein